MVVWHRGAPYKRETEGFSSRACGTTPFSLSDNTIKFPQIHLLCIQKVGEGIFAGLHFTYFGGNRHSIGGSVV
jgi:hypothetical protein